MEDLDIAIAAAWERVKARIADDPDELRKRLARQQRVSLTRTPRARCLAIRANDLRIDETRFEEGARHLRHDVWLDADEVRRLCAPVEITPPGETVHEVAARLGVTAKGLRRARLAGTFRTHHIEGLGGWWGRPVPLIYTERQLDPAAASFTLPDALWGWLARDLYRRIADDFQQTIVRVPCFWPAGWRFAEDVLDIGDGDDEPARPRRKKETRKLPPPEPDPVAYKWKDGTFVGYDWRAAEANPLIKQNYERRQRRLAKNRAWRREWRKRNPRQSSGSGSMLFRGWRWLCPDCGRPANVVFYPLPAISKLHYDLSYHCDAMPKWFVDAALAALAAEQAPRPARRFACDRCAGVTHISLATANGWNRVISYLTRGLLRGLEVPRPPCASAQRKIPYAPRRRALSAESLRRRAQVCRRLVEGWTYARIAAELGITWHAVREHAKLLYRQHGVRGRHELADRLGVPLARPVFRSEQVYARLARGETYAEIAAALDIPRGRVAMYAWRFRHKVVGQRAAVDAPPQPATR